MGALAGCKNAAPTTDAWLIKNGTIYDGSGSEPFVGDVLIQGDTIAAIEKPHQLATGVRDVFVNGQVVLKNGEATGAKEGRVIRGAGFKQ